MQNFQIILPEIFIAISIMIFLILGVFAKNSYKLIYNLTFVTLILSILLVLNQQGEVTKIFQNSYIFD